MKYFFHKNSINHPRILMMAGLLFVTWIVFGRTIGYEFVWDDITIHLVENPYFNPPTFDNLLFFWQHTYEKLYIPVSYTIWGMVEIFNQHIVGIKKCPDAYHMINVIFHSLNGLLIFLILNKLIKDQWACATGSLLFIVHPVQVEAVAWISEFRGLLSSFFGFSALYFYISVSEKKFTKNENKYDPYRAIAGFFLFTVSILAKPSSVVMPLFAAVIDAVCFRFSAKSIFSRLWFWIIPVAFILWRTASVQATEISRPFWMKIVVWMDAISFYIYKIILPFSLAADYARTPEYLIKQWWVGFVWIIPACFLACVLYFFLKKQSLHFTASLIFIIGFLPVSGLIDFQFQFTSSVADRYLYLSMFGVAIFFSSLMEMAAYNWQRITACCLLLFLLIWTGLVQVPVWNDSLSLWNQSVKISPYSAFSLGNRGAALVNIERYDDALNDLNLAISISPNFAPPYVIRGALYQKLNELDKAISDYSQAISKDQNSELAYLNRGAAFLDLTIYEKALLDFEKVTRLNPENIDAYYNKGKALSEIGNYSDAFNAFNKCIQLDPNYVDAYIGRANLYQHLEDLEKAILEYSHVLKIDPRNIDACMNKAAILIHQNKHDEAIEILNQVSSMSPNLYEVYLYRGNAYLYSNEFEKAITDYDMAISISPDKPGAFSNRAIAYFQEKKYQKAVTDILAVKNLGGTPNQQLWELLKPYVEKNKQ